LKSIMRRNRLGILALLLVLAGVLLGTSYYVVRNLRIKRQLEGLLKQANWAEEQGRVGGAAELLGLYLRQTPKDTATRARYGLLLDQLATTPEARKQV